MRRFTRLLFPLPHNGGAQRAPARERRGAKGPRERPSRGVGRSPTLVRACEKMRRLNAELAEHAENSWRFFSAVSAISAVNGFLHSGAGLLGLRVRFKSEASRSRAMRRAAPPRG